MVQVMESYVKSINSTRECKTDNSPCAFWINAPIERLLDKLLFLVEPAVEYIFGMHIGFAFGWLIGLCAGHSYVKHFEPTYLDDLSQLSFWREAPYVFAKHGALTGLAIGVIAIAIINGTLLNQRVTSLFEKKITNPNEIARLLDKSVGQIERKMNKLVKKGRISRKAITP